MPQDTARAHAARPLELSVVSETNSETDVMSKFLSIGILGETQRYNIPRSVLQAAAHYLGGTLVEDLPPFFIACSDGLALVFTLRQNNEYTGVALALAPDQMLRMDKGLFSTWNAATHKQTLQAFFHGTAFQAMQPQAFPETLAAPWRHTFC